MTATHTTRAAVMRIVLLLVIGTLCISTAASAADGLAAAKKKRKFDIGTVKGAKTDLQALRAFAGQLTTKFKEVRDSYATQVSERAPAFYSTTSAALINKRNNKVSKKLKAAVRRLKLGDRVRLLGAAPRGEVARWLAAADVFALSSLHEGDPVVIREALACGTPVVAPRVGGIPELITGDQYGLLCEANDSLQLAHCLDNALTRVWDRAALSQYGARHTWDTVAAKLLDICRDLAPDAAGGGARSG